MPSLLKRICSVGTRHNPFEASLVISALSNIREMFTAECEANLLLSMEAGSAQPLADSHVMDVHDSSYADIQSSLGAGNNNTLSISIPGFELPPADSGEASTAVMIGRRLARDSMAILEFTGSLYETPRGVKMYREKAEEVEHA